MLIETSGYSGVEAGSALVLAALMLTFASPLMGRVAGRIGPRLPLTVGPLVVGVGFLLALRIGPQADYWTEVLPAILVISLVWFVWHSWTAKQPLVDLHILLRNRNFGVGVC